MKDFARLEYHKGRLTGVLYPLVVRGKINVGDKHWGARSNSKFLKLLLKKVNL